MNDLLLDFPTIPFQSSVENREIVVRCTAQPADFSAGLLRWTTSLLVSVMVQLSALIAGAVAVYSIHDRSAIVLVSSPTLEAPSSLDEPEMIDALPTIEIDLPEHSEQLFVAESHVDLDVPWLEVHGRDRATTGVGRRPPVQSVSHIALPRDIAASEPVPAPSADPTVTFFGITTTADSAVFVVDCSGSMISSYLAAAKREVVHAVEQMQAEQEFTVIFFHEDLLAMSWDRLLPVTSRTKSELGLWVSSVSKGRTTNVGPAMSLAADLKPEVIYLLSDGIFDPLRGDLIEQLRQQRTVVNTISFYSIQRGVARLQEIADATDGQFRLVPRDEIMREH